MKYVIRLDLEVDVEDQDAAGAIVNQLTAFAVDVFEPEHYRWRIAQVDDGLDDADLEKAMAQAWMVG